MRRFLFLAALAPVSLSCAAPGGGLPGPAGVPPPSSHDRLSPSVSAGPDARDASRVQRVVDEERRFLADRAYREGLEAVRSVEYRRARDAFRRTLDEDPFHPEAGRWLAILRGLDEGGDAHLGGRAGGPEKALAESVLAEAQNLLAEARRLYGEREYTASIARAREARSWIAGFPFPVDSGPLRREADRIVEEALRRAVEDRERREATELREAEEAARQSKR